MQVDSGTKDNAVSGQNQAQSNNMITDVQAALEDPEVRSEIMSLQNAEDKVIAHENAHKSVGGEFAGAASYGYTTGPDGKRYISSGEVSISVPATGEPEALISALERVKQAAMAPAEPSPQDQRVAASASAKIGNLRADIAKQKAMEAYSDNATSPDKLQSQGTDNNTVSGSVLDLLI
jgi:hypothetical protein